MSENNEPSTTDHQTLAEQKYAALKRAVENADFFAPQVIGEQETDYIVCTSEYREGYGYTGRIVFVSEVGGCWYIATPHPYHYRILDSGRVEQAVIAFLGQHRNGEQTVETSDGDLQEKFIQICYEEYERAISRG